MNKKTQSVKKQTASIDAAAAIENNNTNNTNNTNNAPAVTEQPTAEQAQAEQPTAEQPTAEQPTAEQPTAEQPETLCTIGGAPIKAGDTIRLKADTTNGTAVVEVNPTDDSRNPDKPNGWRVDTREAYKNLQKAMKGLRVSYAYTDDRRARVEGQAVIVGCGMDSTNDRATLKLSTGSVIASGYCFKVLGYDSNYAHTERTTDTTDTDNRPAALIRADIADLDKKIQRCRMKRETLQKALAKALETDLEAVRSTLELHPISRDILEAAINVPAADRVPADRLEALKAVEDIPAAAMAVRNLIIDAYSEAALVIAEVYTASDMANADKVAAIMAERGLKLGDIPTEILP